MSNDQTYSIFASNNVESVNYVKIALYKFLLSHGSR